MNKEKVERPSKNRCFMQQSVCEEDDSYCGDNEVCIPDYQNDGVLCKCVDGYFGKPCGKFSDEWGSYSARFLFTILALLTQAHCFQSVTTALIFAQALWNMCHPIILGFRPRDKTAMLVYKTTDQSHWWLPVVNDKKHANRKKV